ncbi:MAG: hypothetical protein ACTILK_00225 [Bifidobacterium crudilactis]|uniref:hypothetical protein n=1 Tax=Bifidobacterium crudilactis TaxID=327277 RepID=UPI003F9D018F
MVERKGVPVVARGTMVLNPVFSWVPGSLSSLVSGVLGLTLLLSVGVLAVSVIMLCVSPFIDNMLDKPRSVKRVIAVMVGSMIIGSLAGMVGWGCDLWPDGVFL